MKEKKLLVVLIMFFVLCYTNVYAESKCYQCTTVDGITFYENDSNESIISNNNCTLASDQSKCPSYDSCYNCNYNGKSVFQFEYQIGNALTRDNNCTKESSTINCIQSDLCYECETGPNSTENIFLFGYDNYIATKKNISRWCKPSIDKSLCSEKNVCYGFVSKSDGTSIYRYNNASDFDNYYNNDNFDYFVTRDQTKCRVDNSESENKNEKVETKCYQCSGDHGETFYKYGHELSTDEISHRCNKTSATNCVSEKTCYKCTTANGVSYFENGSSTNKQKIIDNCVISSDQTLCPSYDSCYKCNFDGNETFLYNYQIDGLKRTTSCTYENDKSKCIQSSVCYKCPSNGFSYYISGYDNYSATKNYVLNNCTPSTDKSLCTESRICYEIYQSGTTLYRFNNSNDFENLYTNFSHSIAKDQSKCKKYEQNSGNDQEDIVNCEELEETTKFLNKIFTWIQIVAPIAVIVLSSIDFASAILQDDKDAQKKAFSKLMKRLIIAVVLIIVPALLKFIFKNFNLITGAGISTCGIGE